MSIIRTTLPTLVFLGLTAGCAGTASLGSGNGLSKTLDEMQLQYPAMNQALFASFDTDGNGLLDSMEQQAVFQASTSPNGMAGTAGALNNNTMGL